MRKSHMYSYTYLHTYAYVCLQNSRILLSKVVQVYVVVNNYCLAEVKLWHIVTVILVST